MRFLPEERVTNSLIPLNFIYDRGESFGNDSLTIIYKDNDSGMKSHYTIKKPQIEIYIVKPEFRHEMQDAMGNPVGQSRHWYPIEKCDKYTVPYATRFHEAAKILDLNGSEEAKLSPFLYGADIEVENFYLVEFVHEYPCDGPKRINMGYFDIENDTIRINHFPDHGEVPINAVTYIDEDSEWVYTLVLAKDDIPEVSKEHPKYLEYKEMKESFYEQVEKLNRDMPEFIQHLHETYDEKFGPSLEYTVVFFTDEIQLIRTLFDVIRQTNPDYVYAWNLPYDMQVCMNRPGVLGYDVNEVIPDPKILADNPNAKCLFVEDKNAKVARRRHICNTWTYPTFLDQMVVYAGIRAGRGELASTKLNYIAEIELKDEKLNYEEDGDIRTLAYRNFRKFVEYNIKDVLLQVGIEKKNHDIQTIYSRLYSLNVLPNQAFTTTKVVLYALYGFAIRKGFILGQNRNKGHQNDAPVNYAELFQTVTDDTSEDDYFDLLFGEDDDPDDDDPDKKREKYAGAFVMNPLYIQPTGVKIRGVPSKWLHEDVADSDVTSEYPSAIIIGNISSETLVGRVFLEGEVPEIPIPAAFEFRGDEGAKYKCDPSNFMLEQFSEGDPLSFGETFLGLPSFSEVCQIIEGEVEI